MTKSPIYSKDHKELVKRLQEAREHSGLSQASVAKKLGVHQATVSDIECGQRRFDIDLLQKLLKIYGDPFSVTISSKITISSTKKM